MRLPIAVLALLLVGPAAAQSLVPGPSQPGRYEMQPIAGGVARLDTVTGDVSLCRVEGGTLRCRPSEDDDALAAAPDGERPPAPSERGEAATDAELDKALGRLKRVFRAFGDIAREFESERDPIGSGRT